MPSIPSETKVYILNEPPAGAIKPDTFKIETQPLPKESELKEGELLLKTIALSNDPAQRTWMQKDVDAVSKFHNASQKTSRLTRSVEATVRSTYPQGTGRQGRSYARGCRCQLAKVQGRRPSQRPVDMARVHRLEG